MKHIKLSDLQKGKPSEDLTINFTKQSCKTYSDFEGQEGDVKEHLHILCANMFNVESDEAAKCKKKNITWNMDKKSEQKYMVAYVSKNNLPFINP